MVNSVIINVGNIIDVSIVVITVDIVGIIIDVATMTSVGK